MLYNKDKTRLIQYPLGNKRTDYTIPNTVTAIDLGAFYGGLNLVIITIPDTVESMGIIPFGCCLNLKEFKIDGDSKFYTTDEYGALFNKSKTSLIQYPVGNERESYIIPNSVTTIEYRAFSGCTTLSNVTMSKNVTTIEDEAFDWSDSITDVYYSGTEEEWNKIIIGHYNESLGKATIHFNYCTHIFSDWTIVTQPTCTENGLEKRVCLECSKIEERKVPAIGHKYELRVTAPTCTEKGLTTYTCYCGDSYVANYVNATGHTLTWYILSVASCNTNGVMHGYCEDCSYFEVKTTPQTDHADNDGDGKCDSCAKVLCDHSCHKGGISGFFWKITLFFSRLFGSNKFCECGIAHY